MAEPNQHREEENFDAPDRLVNALNHLQKERIFVPPAVDKTVLLESSEHLRRLERPQSRWKPRLSWAVMAACLAVVIWLGERLSNPGRRFAREDINRDGRVDVLDAFALARQIDSRETLERRWDINGDGRVDRADVNAIAARAVNLAQVEPEPKRSADSSAHREGPVVWRTEVRAAFFGLLTSSWDILHFARSTEYFPLTLTLSLRERTRRTLITLCAPEPENGPLTRPPATLSPTGGEGRVRGFMDREQRASVTCLADGRWANCTDLIERRWVILPLPRGEGRGEEEPSVALPTVTIQTGSQTRAPLAPLRCAVSQSCTWPTVGTHQCVGLIPRQADCKSAIRQTENLRYETGAERVDVAPVARSCTLPFLNLHACRHVLPVMYRQHACKPKGSHS